MNETKREKFKRLAVLRGNRLLKDIELLSNLSNRNNYEYSEDEITKLFKQIEAQLKASKAKFYLFRNKELRL